MKENDKMPVKFLSGGVKRKLSIGMALIGDARFIILDEPTANLDYHSRKQIWKVIKSISKGRAILLTT
jgi:ABC-type multidrug transport system ATPase subunit